MILFFLITFEGPDFVALEVRHHDFGSGCFYVSFSKESLIKNMLI